MQFKWIITDQDVSNLQSFVEQYKDNTFVKTRLQRNVNGPVYQFTKESFWKSMISCLLTTQQRSGPKSKITQFISFVPFPLSYEECKKEDGLDSHALTVFKRFGWIRRTERISKEIEYNFNYLENWWRDRVISMVDTLTKIRNEKPNKDHINIERDACILLQNLKGFGPKQSRNLRQSLWLLRYEIPIDSRIIKWLNSNWFPFKLSPIWLSDEYYYQLLADWIQELCFQSNILPCIADASIFTSFDKDEWEDQFSIW